MRDADQIDGGCGDTSSVAAILANTPVKRRPTIASALDPRSRTDALAGWCVQLRQHLPPPSQWLRHWQRWQARSMRPAHPLPRRQWQQQVMLAFGSPVFDRHARPRQIRRTPADPPVTRAGAARSTARVDCHSRLNVRKLLGDAQACIRCGKASSAAGGGWSRLT